MDIAEALQIVIDLAKNALGHLPEDSVHDQAQQAIDMVEDLAVNEYGDD